MPENLPAPQVRLSNDDRDQAVQRLQHAFATGVLTTEELEERIGHALTARSHGELAPAVADLPADPLGGVIHLKSGGRVKRVGAWRVPRVLRIESAYGGVHLDLSKAVIDYPVIEIDLQLPYGSATIIVPSGATVDADGVAMEWGSAALKVPARKGPESLRIRVTGRLTYGRLKIRYARAWAA